jgi:CubicO group peptidase (beta-lactamase class C family)
MTSPIPLAVASIALGLAGIWQCTLTFGPPLGGRVTLRAEGARWNATAGGHSATSPAAFPLRFRFPGGTRLAVRRLRGGLAGQWTQPPLVTSGEAFATPLAFAPAGRGVWVGTARPLPDVAHFFLAVRARPDGSVRAVLRNPEFNIGGPAVLTTDGDSVQLTHGRRVVNGWRDPSGRELTLYLPGALADYAGPVRFTRVAEENAVGYVARRGHGPYVYRVPATIPDGWQTASMQSVGLDPKPVVALVQSLLGESLDDVHAPYIQSLTIARHGKLVLDEYFFGSGRDRPHDVRSAGKSVTTLMVGRAMEDGAPFTPRSLVYPLFPQYAPFAHPDPRKARMRVADLMTMSSGLACDDDDDRSPGSEDTMQSQSRAPDWYKFTLDLPMAHDPGTASIYCSAGINLLGGVISGGSRASLVDAFYDRFAVPLQFRQYGMFVTPPPRSVAYMGGGDYFVPRDFLKFGELFLDRGHWNGTRVIDPSWLRAVSMRRTTVRGELGEYGYGWHLYEYQVRGRTIRAISAGGNGGQLLFVFPQLDMTVLIMAANYGDYLRGWKQFIERIVPRNILPAALH